MSKRFDELSADAGPWHEWNGRRMRRDLLTGTDTTGAVDLGPEGAVALIERTS